MFRVTYNDNIKEIFDRENNAVISDLSVIEEQVKSNFKKKLSSGAYMVFVVHLSKQKIELYKGFKEKFENLLILIRKMIPICNRDKLN